MRNIWTPRTTWDVINHAQGSTYNCQLRATILGRLNAVARSCRETSRHYGLAQALLLGCYELPLIMVQHDIRDISIMILTNTEFDEHRV
jgi:hypothetical protein